MSFEFFATLVDQLHFTKGMFVNLDGDSQTCFAQSADTVRCGALGREKGGTQYGKSATPEKALY